ncbi:hypothetical protein GEMRC1_006708 [Eukaryota sp. GEM-RC1]
MPHNYPPVKMTRSSDDSLSHDDTVSDFSSDYLSSPELNSTVGSSEPLCLPESILSLINLHLLDLLLNCSLDRYQSDPRIPLSRLKQELPTLFEKVGYVSQSFFKCVLATMKDFFESNCFPTVSQDLPLQSSLACFFGSEVQSVYLWDYVAPKLEDLVPYCNIITGISVGIDKDNDLDFLNSFSPFYFSRLKELDLFFHKSSICTKLSELLKVNSTVTKLSLLYRPIDNEEVITLADALKVNSTITDLCLDVFLCPPESAIITIEGAKALAEVLKVNSSITSLRLQNRSIGDEGAIVLANALKENSSISYINLSENSIGPKGGMALFEMLRVNSTIVLMELVNNSIDTETAISLVEILKVNSNIQAVNLRSNRLSPKLQETILEISKGRVLGLPKDRIKPIVL